MPRTAPTYFTWLGIVALTLSALAAGRAGETPEAVALEYGRALYANDATRLYRLVSSEDQRMTDEATFREQYAGAEGFAREVLEQLALFISAEPVRTTIAGTRATVTLRFKLPNANAPAIASVVHDWDERKLTALSPAERERMHARLRALYRTGKLPVIEGAETFELVREGAGWRVFLNWANGVRIRFEAVVRDLPLEVTFSPQDAMVNPGERLRVTVHARNVGGREVTVRVGHRIEPPTDEPGLALLQCPMFVPVTIMPGQSEDFVSEYLVLKDQPNGVRAFRVTYEFPGGLK